MKINTRLGEVELTTYEENGVNIITHTSLSLLLNSLMAEGKVVEVFVPLTEQIIDTTNGIYLTEVRLKDTSTNAIFRGIGEVNPRNIDSDIAKANPIVMAFNRAMDKAFLSLLGCEKRGENAKFYSSIEMPSKEEPQAQPQPQVVAPSLPPLEETKPVTTPVEANIPQPMKEAMDKVAEQVATESVEEAPVDVPVNEDDVFEADEPIIAPVKTSTSKPVKKESPLEEVSKDDIPTPTATPVEETPVEEAPAPTVDPKKAAGEMVIPSGRLAGKKLCEADEDFIKWFKDATMYGSCPPNYNKAFLDAFNLFVS